MEHTRLVLVELKESSAGRILIIAEHAALDEVRELNFALSDHSISVGPEHVFAWEVGDSDAVLFELLAEGIELRKAMWHCPAVSAARDFDREVHHIVFLASARDSSPTYWHCHAAQRHQNF